MQTDISRTKAHRTYALTNLTNRAIGWTNTTNLSPVRKTTLQNISTRVLGHHPALPDPISPSDDLVESDKTEKKGPIFNTAASISSVFYKSRVPTLREIPY